MKSGRKDFDVGGVMEVVVVHLEVEVAELESDEVSGLASELDRCTVLTWDLVDSRRRSCVVVKRR